MSDYNKLVQINDELTYTIANLKKQNDHPINVKKWLMGGTE